MNETCPNCPHPPHASVPCDAKDRKWDKRHKYQYDEACSCFASIPTSATRLAEARQLLIDVISSDDYPMYNTGYTSGCRSCDYWAETDSSGNGTETHKPNCIRTQIEKYLAVEWTP